MKKENYKFIFPVVLVTLLGLLYFINSTFKSEVPEKIARMRSTSSPKAGANSKEGRDEFLAKLMMDPATKKVPADAIQQDIRFTESIKAKGLRKSSATDLFDWEFAGPNNVGGRTRAIAIDVRDPNIVIAGGVSGGIWKTTDNGTNWIFKSNLTHVLSISYIVQDTRTGHQNTWYASTGEYSGNSASQNGAAYRGAGIYKSTDNGETWTLLPKTDNVTLWDNPLDYVSNIQVSPVTGSIFIASNGYGIYKSTNEGDSFSPALESDSRYVEIDIASNGNIVATLSEDGAGTTDATGVYYSGDDGAAWTDITPGTWPVGTGYRRSVIDFAPSNENLVYILTDVNDGEGDHRLHKINLSSNNSVDLSANLPAYTNGAYTTQGSYDMLIAVKPDDENFVLIGGTSLYRSFDGFATALNDSSGYQNDPIDNCWIGGYDNSDGNGSYPNSHADIHSFAFDPNNPEKVWIGHDGGLKYTDKISAIYPVQFTGTFWELKNRNYNVTQVYQVSIPNKANDERILIGCQDNGTPFFRYDGTTLSYLNPDISSGDGSYNYFGSNYAYVSTQFGSIIQVAYKSDGTPANIFSGDASNNYYAFIHPASAENQLFVNPFAVDPNSQNIMYYPDGNEMWRNLDLASFPKGGTFDGNDLGWVKLDNLAAPTGFTFSAMEFSRVNIGGKNPVVEHRLYYAASSDELSAPPIIYRLENTNSISLGSTVNVSISGMANCWIHDIAVNPNNSDEVIVVATNYNIVGLYHTTDAGATWTPIEGNLEGDNGKGPSLRSAVILPMSNGTRYLVGTSAGLFSTLNINGNNTVWSQEGADLVGNIIVESMDSRTADNYVAIGTHGRGVFVGTAKNAVGVKQLNELPTSYSLSQNYPNPFNPTTKIRYSVPVASKVSLKIFNTNGEEVAEVINKYQSAGTFEVDWNGTNSRGVKVASGAYVYTLHAGDFVQSKKMIMLK